MTARQTRADRWEMALADYLTRQSRTPGDGRSAVAVTVMQAEPAAGTHIVVPLTQFCARIFNNSQELQ